MSDARSIPIARLRGRVDCSAREALSLKPISKTSTFFQQNKRCFIPVETTTVPVLPPSLPTPPPCFLVYSHYYPLQTPSIYHTTLAESRSICSLPSLAPTVAQRLSSYLYPYPHARLSSVRILRFTRNSTLLNCVQRSCIVFGIGFCNRSSSLFDLVVVRAVVHAHLRQRGFCVARWLHHAHLNNYAKQSSRFFWRAHRFLFYKHRTTAVVVCVCVSACLRACVQYIEVRIV